MGSAVLFMEASASSSQSALFDENTRSKLGSLKKKVGYIHEVDMQFQTVFFKLPKLFTIDQFQNANSQIG